MTHAVERTNPKGVPFIGKCIKCGKEGLGVGGALEPCPADGLVSEEELWRAIIEGKHDD